MNQNNPKHSIWVTIRMCAYVCHNSENSYSYTSDLLHLLPQVFDWWLHCFVQVSLGGGSCAAYCALPFTMTYLYLWLHMASQNAMSRTSPKSKQSRMESRDWKHNILPKIQVTDQLTNYDYDRGQHLTVEAKLHSKEFLFIPKSCSVLPRWRSLGWRGTSSSMILQPWTPVIFNFESSESMSVWGRLSKNLKNYHRFCDSWTSSRSGLSHSQNEKLAQEPALGWNGDSAWAYFPKEIVFQSHPQPRCIAGFEAWDVCFWSLERYKNYTLVTWPHGHSLPLPSLRMDSCGGWFL